MIPVHPHACGEHGAGETELYFEGGSSPRMWGTRAEERCSLQRLRFIPTHVGNTCPIGTTFVTSPVHPHACGEHYFFSKQNLIILGSSPRMWGTHK